MNRIRVLHITQDDKFFDGVYSSFESDERLQNKAILSVNIVENYKFRYIKHTDKIVLLDEKGMGGFLRDGQYDVVFFYSLPPSNYKYFQYIPKEKKIIWWCWGYEIYGGYMGMPPIIPINKSYLSLTEKLGPDAPHTLKEYLKSIKYSLNRGKNIRRLEKILPRIDYFQPVLPIELQLMKQVPGFKAKEFYYPRLFSTWKLDNTQINPKGSVFFGNSATYSNNHLDVWERIRHFIPQGRTVILPISYGDKRYARLLQKKIKSTIHDIRFLVEMMPFADYFNLVNECSYAVYGVLRQQAMGNIYQSLQKGAKVFLYRDSLVYKDLVENGFVVYAIDDIDEQSFVTPLTEEELEQQAIAFDKRREYVVQTRNNAFNEIISLVNESH